MHKKVRLGVVRVVVAVAWLILLTGCEFTTNAGMAAPDGVSTGATDLTLFVQQFTREAFAALLL